MCCCWQHIRKSRSDKLKLDFKACYCHAAVQNLPDLRYISAGTLPKQQRIAHARMASGVKGGQFFLCLYHEVEFQPLNQLHACERFQEVPQPWFATRLSAG